MSVTIARFVRVMSDGKVVTDGLVKKLDAKLAGKVAVLEGLIADVEKEGAPAHDLRTHMATLKELHANARLGKDNAAKSDMLDRGKELADRAIATGRQRVVDAPLLALDSKVDAALAELAIENTAIPDNFLKTRAAEKLAGLTERRNQLRTAGDGRGGDAEELLKDVGYASSWTAFAVGFGKPSNRIVRGQARFGAALYAREGKKLSRKKDPADKELGKTLMELAVGIKQEIDKIEEDAKRNPREAGMKLARLVQGDLRTVETLYKESVLAPVVLPGVKAMIAADPKGLEAQMEQALSPKVFEQRLLSVNNIAKVFGTPEMALLTPGEAVALFSYTTGDYQAMNGLLLTGDAGEDQDPKKVQTKIDAALKAMAKLPDHSVPPTNRGEKKWPPADGMQYVLGNEFTLKHFWSTGAGFSFGGVWQITVFGTSGKNVASFSNMPHEAEVLFSPGTKFRVKRVQLSGVGGDVVVEEI